MTASKLASEGNPWDTQEGHRNCQLWMGHANCPFLSQLNHKKQASTGNEDTQQARLHNYDKESMVQTLSPCPMHEPRPCLGLALLLSGMGWLIPSDSLKSQADVTACTARTDVELHADARTKSHLAVRKLQHFKSWAWSNDFHHNRMMHLLAEPWRYQAAVSSRHNGFINSWWVTWSFSTQITNCQKKRHNVAIAWFEALMGALWLQQKWNRPFNLVWWLL